MDSKSPSCNRERDFKILCTARKLGLSADTFLHLPADPNRDRNHLRVHRTRIGLVISNLGEKLQTTAPHLDIDPSADVATKTSAGDGANHLVGGNKRVEEHAKERIKNQSRHQRGFRKLHHPPVVTDATDNIRINLRVRVDSDFWIRGQR